MTILERLVKGERIVVSDAMMDELEKQDWAIVRRLASIPNPARVGLLDKYVAFLK